MKKLYIIKVGTTFPATEALFGDFDVWTKRALSATNVDVKNVNVEQGEILPKSEACAGVVITGSHSMVTENLPWSVRVEGWIRELLEASIPIFGICYGHQLLARAAGGEVGYHPQGKEIGTVSVELLSACAVDPIFHALPPAFLAHVTHAQSALRLPEGAVRLAKNAYEPNQAFRVGECAYGVQFHPEYSDEIMKSYIQEQKDELEAVGMDVEKIMLDVAPTPVAAQLIQNFASLVKDRLKKMDRVTI